MTPHDIPFITCTLVAFHASRHTPPQEADPGGVGRINYASFVDLMRGAAERGGLAALAVIQEGSAEAKAGSPARRGLGQSPLVAVPVTKPTSPAVAAPATKTPASIAFLLDLREKGKRACKFY